MPSRLRGAAALLLLPAALSALRGESDEESTQEAELQREASALELRYLPGVHAQSAAQAFDAVTSQSKHLKSLLKAYNGACMPKKTSFSCGSDECKGLGKTDCLEGSCFCQDGFGFDGSKCTRGYQQKPCTAKDVVKTMLLAGVREPDEMPCPGGALEEGGMGHALFDMVVKSGERFNVSMCRTGVQVYHASALPLVKREDLQGRPLANGGSLTGNAGADLFSVMTNRQLRTQAIQVMSSEFAYAITMPDLAEAAKRLGNLFHTLGDSFSASHVVREIKDNIKDGEPSAEVCKSLTVDMVMSMDVMNFIVHVFADKTSTDILFKCSAYYAAQTIKLWAKARQKMPANAVAVNKWVDKLVKKVLCPSLPMLPKQLGKPAGGANAYYSAANTKVNVAHVKAFSGAPSRKRPDVPTEPRGMVSNDEAQAIVKRWNLLLGIELAEKVQKAKEEHTAATPEEEAVALFDVKRRFPDVISLPGISLDACEDPKVAYVGKAHVNAALKGTLPPQYLVPHYKA